ncbi:MAG: hypothetical protein HRT58_10730 [Crocinitomicaceae bacterium]|nr:hypothetical protein [Flavobacteriales bacterium]NQZ36129.1 hypothetical protein [Crocinitomicaceae bacterium]
MKHLFLIFLLATSCSSEKTYSEISSLNNIKIGDVIQPFAGITDSDSLFSSDSQNANCYVYFVNNELSPICLNKECGLNIDAILDSDGMFIGGSDGKFAKTFGVNYESVDGKLVLDNSVLIIVNQTFEVVSIYEKVAPNDLKEIFELEKEHLHIK